MKHSPLRIDDQTRAYVRAAMRDTLAAYDLADLLDMMADICQANGDAARMGSAMGLTADAWEVRAEVLRQAADRLDEAGPDGAA